MSWHSEVNKSKREQKKDENEEVPMFFGTNDADRVTLLQEKVDGGDDSIDFECLRIRAKADVVAIENNESQVIFVFATDLSLNVARRRGLQRTTFL